VTQQPLNAACQPWSLKPPIIRFVFLHATKYL